MTRQHGFTLVELAVGLLVIALLLATILGVESLLAQSRVRDVARDATALAGALQLYRARYDALPGDDPRASTRWPGVAGGNGNGAVGGRHDSVAPLDAATLASGVDENESMLVWWHLRRAGFLIGPTEGIGAASAPFAPGGYRMGLQTAAYGIVGTVVCMNDAPGDIAESLDRSMDDGSPHTGTVRAGATLARPAERYAAAARYVVCVCLDGRHGPSVLAADTSGSSGGAVASGGSGAGNGDGFAGTGSAGNGGEGADGNGSEANGRAVGRD